MTDTAPEIRGGFPEIKPAEHAPAGLGRFVAAMRRLQDLTVSTDPDGSRWTTAAEHVENACALLDGHQVPEGRAPAGRVIELQGLGHPCCHRGPSPNPDRTASPWQGTSPEPTWVETTPCMAA